MRFQISFTLALLGALLVCMQPGAVAAGGRIPTLRYRGGLEGRVVFDHQKHASKGLRCNDCHTDFVGTGKQLFATRKQGLISFADHTAGTKCFACHNAGGPPHDHKAFTDGKGAFDTCAHCHRKI